MDGVEISNVIFVVDGSGLEDEEVIKSLSREYDKVVCVTLSRNFGQHVAITAGYHLSTADYTCMLNVDQQDPISEIPKLINELRTNNADIVYGLRNERKDGIFKTVSSRLFNLFLNKLTGDESPLNVATIRVMNRKFLSAYNSFTEKSRFLPGLEFWLGFRKGYVEIQHRQRSEGKSSYNFRRRIKMALESVISFSDKPLRLVVSIGSLIALIGFFLILYLIVTQFLFIDYRPGYTSTIAIIVFLGGVQLISIGMASIYIGRVLGEVQNRPLYVINEIEGL